MNPGMSEAAETATRSAQGAMGALPLVERDPGPVARLEGVKRDPNALLVICSRVAEGESLKSIAKAWAVPSGGLRLWLFEDDARMTAYRNALVAAGFTEAEEAKEIADDATADDVQVAKLRADVRRWGASKKAPEFFGERVDMQMRAAIPTEADLNAQLAAMLSANPELMKTLVALRGDAAREIPQTITQAPEGAPTDEKGVPA